MLEPYKPYEPQKTYITNDFEILNKLVVPYDGNSSNQIDLKTLLNFINKNNISNPENIVFCCEIEYVSGEGDCMVFQVAKSVQREIENPRYEKELKIYQKQMIKYEKDLKKYVEWKSKEQKRLELLEKNKLEKRIKAAEQLLKKHGKL